MVPEVISSLSSSMHIDKINDLVKRHENYREQCIGLVPTENLLSPAAKAVMATDLSHRYIFQNPMWKYVGGKYLSSIEETGVEIAKNLFGASYANIRALSGENCTNIMLHGLAGRGKTFYHVDSKDGGHFAARTIIETIGSKRFTLPFDKERAEIDIDACKKAFGENPPDLVYLDSSMMLFPHPVRELRDLIGDNILVYDGSQVLGLIAGKQFQDPLREGADFLSGSCHKSLPGPQKGIILTNRLDLVENIENAIFPGLVSNFHVHHAAALAITLAEQIDFGVDYAKQIIKNSKALAEELSTLGFKVECEDRGFSESHQVWLDIAPICAPDEAIELLHEANLIANMNMIPTLGKKGLRLGTPEVTRLGMVESDMRHIAGLMRDVLISKKDPSYIKDEVIRFSSQYNSIKYCRGE